jgi:hypothetical protein
VEGRGAAYVPAVFGADSREPRPALSRILGLASLAVLALLVAFWVSSGEIDWTLVGFVGVLWAAWSFFSGLYTTLVEPLGRFVANQLTGNVALPVPPESIDDQTVRFERLLAEPLTPHHEMLIGIRLAEIYRTHQHDQAKSDDLLARLRAKYPDAPELAHAGSG